MAKQFAKPLRQGVGQLLSPRPGSPEIVDGPAARHRGPRVLEARGEGILQG